MLFEFEVVVRGAMLQPQHGHRYKHFIESCDSYF